MDVELSAIDATLLGRTVSVCPQRVVGVDVEAELELRACTTLVPRDCSRLETGSAFCAATLTGRDETHATCAWPLNPVLDARISVKV